MMPNRGRPITILMADDDADDRQMAKEAFEEAHLVNDLRFVEDGVELLDYLLPILSGHTTCRPLLISPSPSRLMH
jgi:hypothetical protein